MENKNNFAGIIIPVIIAVILLTVLPIINSINKECPPCEDIPTLYAPTISISDDTLTITPNSNNGAFVNGYKIYVDGVLLDTITSTTYDLSEELTEIGTYEIYVTAYATLFIDSDPSNVEEYVIEPVLTGYKFLIHFYSSSGMFITFDTIEYASGLIENNKTYTEDDAIYLLLEDVVYIKINSYGAGMDQGPTSYNGDTYRPLTYSEIESTIKTSGLNLIENISLTLLD